MDFERLKENINLAKSKIEKELDKMGSSIPPEEIEHLELEYPRNSYPNLYKYPDFSPEVKEEFRRALKSLDSSERYLVRIDRLLKGLEGEDEFLSKNGLFCNTVNRSLHRN